MRIHIEIACVLASAEWYALGCVVWFEHRVMDNQSYSKAISVVEFAVLTQDVVSEQF